MSPPGQVVTRTRGEQADMVGPKKTPEFLGRFRFHRGAGRGSAAHQRGFEFMMGLFIRQGPGSGSFLPLEAGESPYVLGRSPEATIRLEGEGVSRRHAEIAYARGRWMVRDLGSRNGTFVNSLPVRESELSPRDVIVLGTIELLVVLREPGTEPPRTPNCEDASGTLPLALTPLVGLVGESGSMQAVRDAIRRVAPLDVTVVLRGESGTGKELVARAIHAASTRRAGPFVTVNCAAIPEALVDSELFGHERGAFTGATSERMGRFEEVSGGTLFLDEVGDLPLAVQASLLRVLEDGILRRVGGKKDLRVDVRVVAATHRDLERAVRRGGFRNDLYHRLNVFEIAIPPLRDRVEDLPLLAAHFFSGISATIGCAPLRLSDEAMALLRSHPWPGNVRELRNVLERAAISARSAVIGPGDIQLAPLSLAIGESEDQDADSIPAASGSAFGSRTGASPPRGESLPEHLTQRERDIVRAALEASHWNQSEAARRLGVSESKIRKCIRQYGIERPGTK